MNIYNAIHTAIQAHDQQKRKIDNDIYVTHPLEVGMLLAKNGFSDEIIIAGILHDTIEDTLLDLESVREQFGELVADYVNSCTEQNKSLPWLERKLAYLEHMENASTEALFIICADKISNIKSIYRNQDETIWAKFNAGYDDQKWYYSSVLSALSPISGHELYKELDYYIKEVFKI